jgi:hypothetical protein
VGMDPAARESRYGCVRLPLSLSFRPPLLRDRRVREACGRGVWERRGQPSGQRPATSVSMLKSVYMVSMATFQRPAGRRAAPEPPCRGKSNVIAGRPDSLCPPPPPPPSRSISVSLPPSLPLSPSLSEQTGWSLVPLHPA